MKKIFFVFFVLFGGVLFYLSCGDDTASTADTSGTTDIETKDVVEIKDEVILSDTSGDVNEISDNPVKDEGMEISDVISDVEDANEIPVDTGFEDISTDTTPTPPAKILPGQGIDITYNSVPRQIRIDDTYKTLKDIKMSVPDSRVPYYLRMDDLHFDLLFGDTDGSKSLTDDDKLLRIIILRDFDGETEGKTRTGDPLSEAKTELGPSDNSATTNVEGTDYTFDFYFKKGINVGSDKSQIITGFTVYRPQKVVPSDVIDYENSKVLGITADIALFMSNATKIEDMRGILGPEDLMVEDNTAKLIYYNYLSIGFTAIDSQNSSGDVKTIAVFPPYFGKLKGTNLSLGSPKSEIDTFFSSKYGSAKTLQQGDATIYYYVIKTKDLQIKKYDICLGFIYNQSNLASAILVGLPVEQK